MCDASLFRLLIPTSRIAAKFPAFLCGRRNSRGACLIRALNARSERALIKWIIIVIYGVLSLLIDEETFKIGGERDAAISTTYYTALCGLLTYERYFAGPHGNNNTPLENNSMNVNNVYLQTDYSIRSRTSQRGVNQPRMCATI